MKPDPNPVAAAPRGLPLPPPGTRRFLPSTTFAGRSALILAPESALVRAVAKALASAGAEVICGDIDPDHPARLFDAIEASGKPVEALYVAGSPSPPHPSESAASSTRWRRDGMRVIDVAIAASAELARRRIVDGRSGSIVFGIEAAAWTGGPEQAASAAEHGALMGLSKSLAAEWAGRSVRVNTLVAGWFAGDSGSRPERSYAPADIAQRIPALRLGEAHELGWAAAFLLSPYARYVTGAEMVIDGGSWLRRRLLEPERVRASSA